MKKNAFTLIEILAVIVVMGLLAVLIISKVTQTVKDAKTNTDEVSANALARTATNYYLEQKTQNNNFEGCTYDFTNNINTCANLEFTGDKPQSGRLTIRKNGDVALAVQFEKRCYVKGFKMDKIEIDDYNEATCGENAYIFANYEMPTVVTMGDGLYKSTTEDDRYVYRGTNPNNYIIIPEQHESNYINSYYRIISFESDGAIKVVRNESIGNLPWDEGTARQNTDGMHYCTSNKGCNVWSNSEKTIYNNNQIGDNFFYKYYETAQSNVLTDLITQSGKIEDESSLKYSLNSWLSSKNINKYIMEHSFPVGGIYYTKEYENGDKGLIKEKTEENIYTWSGFIGIMNITEFVESSTNPQCKSVYSNYYYNHPTFYYKAPGETNKTVHPPENNNYPCKTQNWAFKPGWSITAFSSYQHNVWFVSETGFFGNQYANNSNFAVYPTLYLKPSVKLSGTGTYEDPYRIINM